MTPLSDASPYSQTAPEGAVSLNCGNVGRSMDDNDRLKATLALENVRTSVPSSWVNPDTRNTYTVVPTRTYDSPSGPCREYTVDAVIGGRIEKVVGTACRQADGSWRNVN